MSTLVEWGESLQASPLGSALAESAIAFPVVEGLHLVSMSLAVGLIFLIDLRLLGLALKALPVDQVLRQFRPWALGAYAVVFVTGGLLFLAEAPNIVVSGPFLSKLIFLALAGLNAASFEWLQRRSPLDGSGRAVAGAAAVLSDSRVRFAAWASLLLWAGVVVSGRLIPYLTHMG